MGQFHFYTLPSDIVAVLAGVEKDAAIHYFKAGSFASTDVPRFNSYVDIPNLGQTRATSGGDAYVVSVRSTPITLRPVPQMTGGIRYLVDQLINSEVVTLCAAGLREDGIVLSGSVGTVNQSDASKKLMNVFRKWFRKECVKCYRYFVGPAAYEMLKQVNRLTHGVTATSTDLVLPKSP